MSKVVVSARKDIINQVKNKISLALFIKVLPEP